ALVRLETLSLMSDVNLPVHVARAQVASAVDVIVQIARFPQDGSRRVTRIAEVGDLDANNQHQIHDLFRVQFEGKSTDGKLAARLETCGRRPGFADEIKQQGREKLVRTTGALWLAS
ncbi:MAG: CpaF/VirB11 family protein, partial [Planctomycetaceae bacterium]|nr:CpaF/VirB11 family protein [Planctomycetaceae bacterium]